KLFTEFILKVPQGRLVKQKLDCLIDIVHSDLFTHHDCREILLPLMTEQLKSHLEKQEELRACCQLLSDIMEVLYRKDVVRNTTLQHNVLHFPPGYRKI
ncbi:Dedicator of cytokinesis protein 1, partial [Goodea atripinnis]